jgi:hypothetical protein
MTRPPFQQRFFLYILGPNQDPRLASVAAGAQVLGVELTTDTDAPFVLKGRSVRHKYTSSLNQANLPGLKTQWADAGFNYRCTYLRESLVMAYYGQFGNPKPIAPTVHYPAGSIISLDLQNTGASAITNLTYYWWGYKLFPWDTVVGYTYPQKIDRVQTFAYPISVPTLGVSEERLNQFFMCKDDADFVIRAGQGPTLFATGGGSPRVFAEVGIILRDFDKRAYMNDYVQFDVLFGSGSPPATIPVGPTPSFVSPFATGPGQPGLFYPEIYLPRDHQIRYDLKRGDGAGGSNQSETFTFNLIGSKVVA